MAGFSGVVGRPGENPRVLAELVGELAKRSSALGPSLVHEGFGGWVTARHGENGEAASPIGKAADGPLQLVGSFRHHRDEGRLLNSDEAARKLLNAWRDSGIEGMSFTTGQFAAAIWDQKATKLYLLRSPLCPFPLAYYRAGQRLSFSSLALALPDGALRRLEVQALATRLTGASFFHQRSLFSGVRAVMPGTLVLLDPEQTTIARFWDPVGRPSQSRANEEAAARIRSALDQSVADAAEASGNPVAAHLSAGRDSTAVTASAAAILGDRVIAYTGAPSSHYPETWDRFLIDESVQAASMARHLKVEHRVVRHRQSSFCEHMDRLHSVHSVPIGTPINLPWWEAILEEAAAAGAQLLLTANAGNLTISNGGPRFLPDTFRHRGLSHWWRAIRGAASGQHSSWANLLKFSLGPFLPRWLYRLSHKLSGRSADGFANPFFKGALGLLIREELDREDPRPAASNRRSWQEALRDYDPADLTAEALHGVTLHDPTASRAVVEAALDLTDEQLMSPYDRRTIFDLAFADRLPVIPSQFARRGIQGADWNIAIRPDDLAAGLERYRTNALVPKLVDVDGMKQAIAKWPSEMLPDGPKKRHFANHLLEAMAVASFLWVHRLEVIDRTKSG